MYKIVNLYGKPAVIIRLSDNVGIPFDPANTDFVEYQKWLELGNEPLPAENE
jgi:hypothetical protein